MLYGYRCEYLQLLSNIRAGYKFRKKRDYKDVRHQYTEEYIRILIVECTEESIIRNEYSPK